MQTIVSDTTSLIIRPESSQFSRVPPYVALEIYRRARGKGHHVFLREAFRSQIESIPDIERLFPADVVSRHYVYEPMRDSEENPDLFVTQLRLYRMCQFFQRYWPDVLLPETTVLDVGDTSGIFLNSLGKQGTSLNINQECVDFIRDKKLRAVCGDAERLDFGDKSFDYVFCFQMLEHVPNPVAVLREIGRVARKAVFVSIPYKRQTVINDLGFWVDLKKTVWGEEEVRDVDCHIFEFSTTDFIRVLSHTPLKYESNFPIAYFSEDSTIRRLLNRRIDSYFNFFVLRPRGQGSE